MAGPSTHEVPLSAEARLALFGEWQRANPDAMAAMEAYALQLDARGKRVAVQYLIEKLRYESGLVLHPVAFADSHGNEHCYGVNNSDRAIIGRWLLARHPGLHLETRRSAFDGRDVA
uniref:hypothetical protein n=1 Tax=Olsenella uli TaxID=133926 RepID=UPI0028E5FC42|nr:hypothetical protein [Olsenella uli]